MKKILLIFVFLFLGLGLYFSNSYRPKNSPAPTFQDRIPQATPNPENTFQVIRVIDGDTIEIESGQKMRYIGIDAPEINVGCFGESSQKKNQELLENKKIIRVLPKLRLFRRMSNTKNVF